MRRYFTIIVAIFLLASLFGVYKTFTLPTEVKGKVAVLNYEHKGEFDYIAHVKAAYLYGDIPLEIPKSPETPTGPPSPQANPKYPADITDRFDMTFTYELVPDKPVTEISQQVEVKATLQKPGAGAQEVVLVPTTTRTGGFTVGFLLSGSELALSPVTTIQANVYTTIKTDAGPIFESFTQSLAIRSKGPLLEVDKNLTSTQRASFGELSYQQTGTFDYSVKLKSNSPFGAITLKPPKPAPEPPPPPPPPPSAKTLGPGETIYSKLFDSMDVTFSYGLEADQTVKQITEVVEINAILENPKVWTKTFVLVPLTQRSGYFSITFPLNTDNFSYFTDVFTTIQRETGASVPYNLTIKADVHTVARTDFGPIDEVFSQTLSTTLGADTIEWKEKLVKSQPGVIEAARIVPNPNKFLRLSVSQSRIVFLTLTGIFLALCMYLLGLYIKFKPEKLSPIDEEALRARKKHKDVIVDVEELPEASAREVVIQFSSLDELVKAADGLLKPVLHKAKLEKHTYCVIDGAIRYQYLLTVSENKPESSA